MEQEAAVQVKFPVSGGNFIREKKKRGGPQGKSAEGGRKTGLSIANRSHPPKECS